MSEPYYPGNTGKYVRIVPYGSNHVLTVTFVFESYLKYHEQLPVSYVIKMLTYAGDHSLE